MKRAPLRGQRRYSYRLPIALDIGWTLLEGEGPIANAALTSNFSEGGVLMVGFEGPPPEIGEWLMLKIPIEGRFPFFVAGQVLRQCDVNEEDRWAVAIGFHGSDERDRDRIFSYIAREQRRQIKKRREQGL